MNTVKIEGLEVLSIGLDRNQQPITQGPNQGEPYWRARYNGRGFIITNQQFIADFDAGNVAVVNVVESEYPVEDPMNPEAKIMRPSYNFVSYATYTQMQQVESHQGKLNLLRKQNDVDMQVLEKKALAALNLDDEKVSRLQNAL